MITGIIGFYNFNKEAPDVSHATALQLSATDLYSSFSKDTVAAKRMHLQKVLEVYGEVTNLSQNQQHQSIILLKTDTDGASINCTMEGSSQSIKKGDKISIKGICNGMGQGDADLGIAPDVYLLRCYVAL